jgi:hypothetical protein
VLGSGTHFRDPHPSEMQKDLKNSVIVDREDDTVLL